MFAMRRRFGIFLVLLVISLPASATQPAKTVRGTLGTQSSLAVSTSYEFIDAKPPQEATSLTFYFRTSRGGTLRIDRVSPDPALPTVAQRVIPDITITEPPPADETVVVIDASPHGSYRVRFTNGAAGTAAISLEAAWDTRSSAR